MVLAAQSALVFQGANALAEQRIGIQWIPVLSMVFFLCAQAGRFLSGLGDLRKVIQVGLGIAGGSLIIIGSSSSLPMIVAMYAVYSTAYHAAFTAVQDLFREMMPQNHNAQRRGWSMFGSGIYILSSLAMLAVPFFPTVYPVVMVGFFLAMVLASRMKLPETERSAPLQWRRARLNPAVARVVWPYAAIIASGTVFNTMVQFYLTAHAVLILSLYQLVCAWGAPIVWLAEWFGDHFVACTALVLAFGALLCLTAGSVPMAALGAVLLGTAINGGISYAQLAEKKARPREGGNRSYQLIGVGLGQLAGAGITLLSLGISLSEIWLAPIPILALGLIYLLRVEE